MSESDDRERIALSRVWRAFGCADNPDDFKTGQRDVMWQQIEEFASEALARNTRVDRENRQLSAILQRQGQLLTDAVNALRGPPPPLTSWSHHDVAELAAEAVAGRTALALIIERARRVPDRDEVVPIDDSVRRHAYIKGGEVRADRFREALSDAPFDALVAAHDAKAWDEAADVVDGFGMIDSGRDEPYWEGRHDSITQVSAALRVRARMIREKATP